MFIKFYNQAFAHSSLPVTPYSNQDDFFREKMNFHLFFCPKKMYIL